MQIWKEGNTISCGHLDIWKRSLEDGWSSENALFSKPFLLIGINVVHSDNAFSGIYLTLCMRNSTIVKFEAQHHQNIEWQWYNNTSKSKYQEDPQVDCNDNIWTHRNVD